MSTYSVPERKRSGNSAADDGSTGLRRLGAPLEWEGSNTERVGVGYSSVSQGISYENMLR